MATVEIEAPPDMRMTPTPPWGWWEAGILHLAVLLAALIVQWKVTLVGGVAVAPPWNWILMGGWALGGIVLGAALRDRAWMRWLAGAKFAIVSIIAVSILALLGTLIFQQPGDTRGIAMFGLRHIFASIPFLGSVLLLLCNLSTVLGRRLGGRKPASLGFLLNHAGVLLVIVGMVAGSAELTIARVHLHEGMPVEVAVDGKGRRHILGAPITLQRFEIEWFPPHLLLASMGGLPGAHQHRISSHHLWIQQGQQFNFEGVQGRVLNYYPNAVFDHETQTLARSEVDLGIAAAEIEFTAPDGGTYTDWIAAGHGMHAPRFTVVDEGRVLYMSNPTPRAYRSHLTIAEHDGRENDRVVSVNAPIGHHGWQLYQSSYAENETTGRMDSILMAVRDPALPVVYLGFFAMLAGALVACWAPARRTTADTGEGSGAHPVDAGGTEVSS